MPHSGPHPARHGAIARGGQDLALVPGFGEQPIACAAVVVPLLVERRTGPLGKAHRSRTDIRRRVATGHAQGAFDDAWKNPQHAGCRGGIGAQSVAAASAP